MAASHERFGDVQERADVPGVRDRTDEDSGHSPRYYVRSSPHYAYRAFMSSLPGSNRERALAAALHLLGTQGIKALTHARVDAAAGLPRGSTSNAFRTRAALLSGAVEAILADELPHVDEGFRPPTAEAMVEGIAALLDHLTGPGRTATTARLVLFLEGSHDADVRVALSAGRAQLIEMTAAHLAHFGAPDPATAAEAVAACMEGLILHRVARHDTSDPRPVLATVIRGALAR